MNFFVIFFRDILDGPLYIIILIINVILICAGIGYFLEKKQLKQEEEKKFNEEHISISNEQTKANVAHTTNSNQTTMYAGQPSVDLSNVLSGRVNSNVVSQITNQSASDINQNQINTDVNVNSNNFTK